MQAAGFVAAVVLIAGGCQAGPAPTDLPADASAGQDGTGGQETGSGAGSEAGSSGTGSSGSSSGAGSGSNGGSSSGADSGSQATDAGPVDTTPITNLPAMTWQYVPIRGAMCRDGSSTGIGVNVNPSSKQLMIYLEGGGACFNSLTCGTNPSSFSDTAPDGGTTSQFAARLGGTAGNGGVFDRADSANPVASWSYVYVPYCTGDMHAGDKPNAAVPGVAAPQQFVGYANVTRALARIVPSFAGLTKVLLTGISEGGFGAAMNYVQTAQAFGTVPVYSLDDSGPALEDPYAAKCLQARWATLWRFDKTVLAYCGADCPDPANYMLAATIHTARTYPNVPFGLIEATDDSVVTLIYGFGTSNCTATTLPAALSASTFTAGLLDARTKAAAYPNVGSFIFQGTTHTSLGGSSLDTVTASGDAGTSQLASWMATLVNAGTVSNAGP